MIRTVRPKIALRALPSAANVIASQGCSTPETLLGALGRHAQERPGGRLSAGLLLGTYPFATAVRTGALQYRTWHVGGPVRQLASDGLVDYVPCRASDVPLGLTRGYDAMLVRVSPPDRHGFCNLGPSLSYTREALKAAAVVIAEVDPAFPRTCGDTALHVDDVDYLVDADTPMCQYMSQPITGSSRSIASHVVSLLPRNPVIQLGIGAIPEAVVEQIGSRDLGRIRVVGMATDRMVSLLDLMGHKRRGERCGILRAVELMGTDTLMSAADLNPDVQMVPSVMGHDPKELGREAAFVSINGALAVDLSGQVAAESIGTRVVAGIGGSFDFFEAAHLSVGGLRIIALPAQAPGGASSIVSRLPCGTAVSIPRHSVDVIVTEYGVARVTGLSLRERADALIAISSPQHRSDLFESVTST